MQIEYKVEDLVDGWAGQAFDLDGVNRTVKRIKDYAEQEGYEPEYAIWLRIE